MIVKAELQKYESAGIVKKPWTPVAKRGALFAPPVLSAVVEISLNWFILFPLITSVSNVTLLETKVKGHQFWGHAIINYILIILKFVQLKIKCLYIYTLSINFRN